MRTPVDRRGDPDVIEARRRAFYGGLTREEFFWAKVDLNGPVPAYAPDLGSCWLWTGSLDRHGYGRLGRDLAHQLAFRFTVGPIPVGLTLDHLCRVHPCVNPRHLEAVTLRENRRREAEARSPIAAARTLCARGAARCASL